MLSMLFLVFMTKSDAAEDVYFSFDRAGTETGITNLCSVGTESDMNIVNMMHENVSIWGSHVTHIIDNDNTSIERLAHDSLLGSAFPVVMGKSVVKENGEGYTYLSEFVNYLNYPASRDARYIPERGGRAGRLAARYPELIYADHSLPKSKGNNLFTIRPDQI